MRLNAKVFELANGLVPVEIQEFDGRKVEIYYMNDFEDVFNQNVPKGKFALWTSNDGFNYRLFIEKGYFEKIGELYQEPVNKIWLDFWDKCDDTTKKYNFRIMLPLVVVCLVAWFVVSSIEAVNQYAMYIYLVILAVFIAGMFFQSRITKQKLAAYNAESVDAIKGVVGKKHFDELLEEQKKYMDFFFETQARLAEEAEKAAEGEEIESLNTTSVAENLETLEEIKNDIAGEEARQTQLEEIAQESAQVKAEEEAVTEATNDNEKIAEEK